MEGLKNLIDKSGMSELDIIAQVKREYEYSKNSVENIKQQFIYEDKLYFNEKKDKEKLGDFTTYSVVNASMARLYINEPQRKFSATRSGAEEIITHLNNVTQTDFNEDDMEVLLYQTRMDSLRRGVGIIARTGWDGVEKKNVFQNIDPRKWFPDPNGGYVSGNYAFSGFIDEVYIGNLTEEDGWFNTDGLVTTYDVRQGASKVRNDDQIAGGINTGYGNNNTDNDSTDIYYHFGTFNGVKALVVTGNDNSVIIKTYVYKPITTKQKKDQTKIEFPLAFFYYDPNDNLAYGNTRIPLLCKDTQITKAMMLNLRMKKSEAELYPMYLANNRKIKNKEDLTFGLNKVISVSLEDGESLTNAITPVQKDVRFDVTNQMDAIVDGNLERAVSIGKIAQGSEPGRREAATTNKLIQGNVDINLLYVTKKFSFGEKQLLRIWLYGYLENFTKGDKKSSFVTKPGGLYPREFSRDEFLGENGNVKILIESKLELEEKKEKERIKYTSANQLLASVNRSKGAQRVSARNMLMKTGLTFDEALQEMPYNVQELKAYRENQALNEGFMMKVATDDDDEVHLLIHQILGNDDISWEHRLRHEQQLRFKERVNPAMQEQTQTGVDQSITRATQSQNAAAITGQAANIESPL